MNCIDCKAPNSDDNGYCGKCGAELGRTLDETVRKKGFRDRQAIEMEITEAIVARLMRWSTWLGSVLALILALFAGVLGLSYHDVKAAVAAGKDQIETAVKDGKTDINQARQSIPGLKSEIDQLQSDANKYKQVNQHIAKLQEQLTKVQGDVLDLSNRDLKIRSVTTSGSGPSGLTFGELGCPIALPKNQNIGLCAQGSPPAFYAVTRTGLPPRPVSSLSPVGFQDTSIAPKPNCNASNRGTFYVEKGVGSSPDKPFLCARNSNDNYEWNQLSTAR
jgi:hypothetical protein